MNIRVGRYFVTRNGENIQVTISWTTVSRTTFPCPHVGSIGKLTKTDQVGTSLGFIIKLTSALAEQEFIVKIRSCNIAISTLKSTFSDDINIGNCISKITQTLFRFGSHEVCISKPENREIGWRISWVTIIGFWTIEVFSRKFINTNAIITTGRRAWNIRTLLSF